MSETPISQNVNRCVQSFAKQSGVGLLVGVGVAAIAFRGTAMRASTAAFATGVGTGASYRDCDALLKEYQEKVLSVTRRGKSEPKEEAAAKE